MKKLLCLLTLFLSLNGFAMTTPNWQWAKTAGSTGWDFAGMDYNVSGTIATDAAGNSYVTGLFNGTATFGSVTITSNSGSQPNVFVAKYDANGNCLWAKNFGGTASMSDIYGNQGASIDIDPFGNCYVTGTFNGAAASTITVAPLVTLTGTGFRQIFIVKYDANGNALWARQPSVNNSANNYAKCIAVDFSGNSYITGYLGAGSGFGSYTLSGPGAYVTKYDAAGNVIWAVKAGQGNADALCIGLDLAGNSYISGYLQGTENFTSTPATPLMTAIGTRDVFVAKVTSSGVLNWVKQYGGANSEAYGRSISIDNYGDIFLTGYFSKLLQFGSTALSVAGTSPGREAFVTKFDISGNVAWAKQSVSNGGYTSGAAIKAKGNGECAVTGTYSGNGSVTMDGISFPNNAPNGHIFVLKFEVNGVASWGQFSTPPNGGAPESHGISFDADGSIFIAGNIQGATAFSSNTTTAYGGYDVLIAKLYPDCTTKISGANSLSSLTIYPNPVNDQLHISGLNSINGDKTICISDITGKTLYRAVYNQESGTVINTASFTTGIYMVSITTEEGTTTYKIAK